MDFLKSAVASAISKGPPFPYTFGDKVDLDPSIWTLYNGTKREDGSNCSILAFDVTTKRSSLPLARNALKKLRTMRHPGVIKVLDTVETDSYIYIATERLVPLRWHVQRRSLTPETAKWGLCSIARTVKFINEDASSIHGNLKVASIYTSESGEWKLGGFEVLSNVKDDEAVIYTYGSLVPDSGRYAPPEIAKSGWDAIKKGPHSAFDSHSFGVLMFEVFNGSFLGSDQVGQTKNIPPSMHSSYKRLCNANPKARLSVGHFLDQGLRKGAFFDTPLIKLTDGVDNLGVKSHDEREAFLDDLENLTDDFPEDFFMMKVLPELLKSVEFGGGGPKAFGIVMKIAKKLSDDDFDAKVTPVIIRLFGVPDRALRVCLLDNLPHMIDRLSQKVVNDKIFPNIVSGFTDHAPVVREQTLKSVLVIINKLSDRTVNGDLLKYLAKTANDEQPGIRTNTTICLGKIAKNLGNSTRAKVLIAAFSRSLRDPFVHARNAALLALAVTPDYFSDEDAAGRIMPALCPLLLDKENLIRDQANKTLDVYVQKIKKAAASMPETVLPPPTAAESGPRMSTPLPTETSSVNSWAGWAISSFTNKLSAAAGEIEPANGQSSSPTSTMRPDPGKRLNVTSSTSASASSLHRKAVKSPVAEPLSRTSSTSVAGDEDGDAWGDMEDHGGGGFLDDSGAFEDAFNNSSNSAATAGNGSAAPFDDGSEPDFAGWLAAQAQKKSQKVLPKGLSRPAVNGRAASSPSAVSTAKKAAVGGATSVASKTKTAPAKKVNLKPKASEDDDGWGDGW